MKILITGVAGFIGSNLCEFILEKGFSVVGMDNFSTGYHENLIVSKNNPNFTFIEGDIRDFKHCLDITKKVEFVFHQAAFGLCL